MLVERVAGRVERGDVVVVTDLVRTAVARRAHIDVPALPAALIALLIAGLFPPPPQLLLLTRMLIPALRLHENEVVEALDGVAVAAVAVLIEELATRIFAF